jgi:hypothetical protein
MRRIITEARVLVIYNAIENGLEIREECRYYGPS